MFYVVLLYYLVHKDNVMKKIMYVLLIFPVLAMASLDMVKVNNALLGLKSATTLKYYISNKSINITKKLKFTSLEDADIIIFSQEKNNKKMLIVDSYKELRTTKNSIGAIYMEKARTQIVFIKERLENNGLVLPKRFQEYIITECQLNPVCLLKLQENGF